ncbi:MAG: hypothetical protein VYD86_04305, partial [Verrucomicrobiota bacterium]|nr:hypothetical protein [Verrucomicrobiota bacterium]
MQPGAHALGYRLPPLWGSALGQAQVGTAVPIRPRPPGIPGRPDLPDFRKSPWRESYAEQGEQLQGEHGEAGQCEWP